MKRFNFKKFFGRLLGGNEQEPLTLEALRRMGRAADEAAGLSEQEKASIAGFRPVLKTAASEGAANE